MPATAASVIADLRALGSPAKAKILAGFFKTGPGEYGEGDSFWGVTVPQTRSIVKAYRGLTLMEIEKLIAHSVHEVRLAGWLSLVAAYEGAKKAESIMATGASFPLTRGIEGVGDPIAAMGGTSSTSSTNPSYSECHPWHSSPACQGRGNSPARAEIFDFYLTHARRANNWDLVDVSAPNVVGDFLLGFSDADRTAVLRKLGTSDCLWERRIAVLATFAFIRAGRFHPAVATCRALLADSHDLLHKACGWMLREMGKRGGLAELRAFLKRHAAAMPRTMLRYAIERMAPDERARWMTCGK